MNPVAVPGAGLVRSRRNPVVLTGSKVMVVGWFDAVANRVCCPVTGTHAVPFQYETTTLLGGEGFPIRFGWLNATTAV